MITPGNMWGLAFYLHVENTFMTVIKFTSCLPMVGGSLRVLHDIAEILLKVALKHQNKIKSI